MGGHGDLALCYGNYAVVEILNFPEPATHFLGAVVTEVDFTFRATDVARWALESEYFQSEFEELAKDVAGQIYEGRALLHLIHDPI